MYLLEKREKHPLFGTWMPWQAKQVLNDINSRNPRKEMLSVFERLKRTDSELWRVTHNNKIIIEQR